MPKAKKTASKSTMNKPAASKSTTNKSAFVRSLPADLSAKDVVAKAKSQGMVLSENYVYTIRSAANIKKTSGKPGRPPASASASTFSPRAVNNGSAEARFVDLALDLGLANAEKLLTKLRASIRNVTLS